MLFFIQFNFIEFDFDAKSVLNWPFYFNCFGVKRFICSKIKVRQLSMWYQTLKFILDYCWLTFHFQFSCWIDWPIYTIYKEDWFVFWCGFFIIPKLPFKHQPLKTPANIKYNCLQKITTAHTTLKLKKECVHLPISLALCFMSLFYIFVSLCIPKISH